MLAYVSHRIAIRDPDRRRKRWPRNLQSRRRFYKAFLRWYIANENRFAIKLERLRHTDDQLDIGFCGIIRVVTAELVLGDEINILGNWDGTFWDMLRCFEAIPKRIPGGYVCDLCAEDTRPVHSSRDDLWRSEIFEPFLAWVNDELACADVVFLPGTSNRGTTWARLEARSGRLALLP